jgi:hypothetical protein
MADSLVLPYHLLLAPLLPFLLLLLPMLCSSCPEPGNLIARHQSRVCSALTGPAAAAALLPAFQLRYAGNSVGMCHACHVCVMP